MRVHLELVLGRAGPGALHQSVFGQEKALVAVGPPSRPRISLRKFLPSHP